MLGASLILLAAFESSHVLLAAFSEDNLTKRKAHRLREAIAQVQSADICPVQHESLQCEYGSAPRVCNCKVRNSLQNLHIVLD